MKTPGIFRKEVVADLCGRCAAIYADSYKLDKVGGGVNNKVVCSACGNRRYGGTYKITKRQKEDAP